MGLFRHHSGGPYRTRTCDPLPRHPAQAHPTDTHTPPLTRTFATWVKALRLLLT